MEGRAYMDVRRNMNEEFILKSMAESSAKVTMPTMEMTGFKNHFPTFRTDGEELFKTWIASEESHSFTSSSMVHRTPQTMGRMARELNYVTPVDDENSTNLDQNSVRNVVGSGGQASSPHLDKTWFHSSLPMTRSRSSELRRNFATLQNFQTLVNMETVHDVSGYNINNLKQETENPNVYCEASFGNILNHMGTYVSPQHSSLSNFNEKRDTEDGSREVYGVQEVLVDMGMVQNERRTYLDLPAAHLTSDHNRVLRAVDRPAGLGFEGFDAADGPIGNGVQNMATTCESSIQFANGGNKENSNGARVMDYMTITDDHKPKERLVRGSVTSADPVDEGEATKKRRVERSRKMAEAKERISTPAVPSDMQSILKRCENLEKEVRSLKLNLAFMNRKDSEQIKQLEELQIQHEELTDEKERLLEEIERILATRGKM